MDRKLILIVLLAAALRLGPVLAIMSQSALGALYQNDSDEYIAMGQAIAEGDFLFAGERAPWQPLFRTPGYPIFLSLFYALGLPDVQAALSQALLDALSTILIFRMAKLISPETAYAAAALFALNPLFIAYSFQLLSETFFLFVFLLANILFLERLRGEGAGLGREALLGAAFGFMIYVKPSSLLFPLIFAAVLHLRGGTRREIALLLLIPAIFALAWMGRNLSMEGEPALSGTALWNIVCYYAGDIANTPGASLEGHSLAIERFMLYDPSSCTNLPYAQLKEGLEPALSLIGGNLPLFAEHTIRGGVLLFDPFNPAGHIGSALSGIPSYEIEHLMLSGGEGFLQFLPSYGYAFAYQLGLYALATWHLSKEENRRGPLFMIFIMLLLYSILMNGPLGYARYRFPLEPLIILFAASGLIEATGRYRRSLSSPG